MERKSKDARGPQPIGDVIRQFLGASALRRTRADERILEVWSQAAGERWRSAVAVAFRAGQLTVEVGSSFDLAQLKSFHGEGLRARANELLGEPRIRKIVFKPKG